MIFGLAVTRGHSARILMGTARVPCVGRASVLRTIDLWRERRAAL